MKKLPLTIVSFLVLTSLFSNCESNKTLPETEFEETVFYEIFPIILDSIHYDMRLMPPPPIPPNLLEEKGYDMKSENDGYSNAYKKWKESDEYKNMMEDWETRTDSIRNDTTSYYLIVPDSISYSKKKVIEHFRETNISSDRIHSSKTFKLDINRLRTNHKNISFKFRNEFPQGQEFWRTKYKYNVVEHVGFSRIIFDKTKNQVILEGSYVRAPLNGYGFKIYTEKTKKGKWVINKIIVTGVS